MSLPQTECAVPPGEQTSVNISPSLPFSDVAFTSQVVGVPAPAEDGGDGAGFELSAEVLVWPPPPVAEALFSFFSFEQPARTIAASKSRTQPPMIRRSCCCIDRYDGVTLTAPFVLRGELLEGVHAEYTSKAVGGAQ